MKRIIQTTFLILLIHSTHNKAAEPGVTPGEFSVDASGAANYTVPIAVPPGTAGMQPSLTLSYNSRSGNGLLGVGWSLGGLSAITRCPKVKVIDDEIDGIEFDADDRFCIDGQRLIQVAGAVDDYGKDGNEYRTEIDGFTKVIAYGDVGDGSSNEEKGPEKFMAWTKSGQILEYGYTTDARIEAQGKTDVRLWAVNKITDTTGNYLTITYNKDTTNGSYTPTQIDYTGNNSANPVLTPNTQVVFEYETRSDTPTLYFAGSMVKNTERLTNIKTYSNSTLVRDYQLSYDNNGAANRSRLTTLTECDGQATQECFSSITFDWNADNHSFSAATYHGFGFSFGNFSSWELITGDFNGDGLTDYGRTSASYSHFFLSNGDGTFSAPLTHNFGFSFGSFSSWELIVGDFNGDGLTDYGRTSVSYSHYFLSNGDGTFSAPQTHNFGFSFGSFSSWELIIGDFNGDGITDYGRTSASYSHLFLGNENGAFSAAIYHGFGFSFGNLSSWELVIADFNGDGLTDYGRTGASYSHFFLSNGDGTFSAPTYHGFGFSFGNLSSWELVIADFNGDGLTDYGRTGASYSHFFLSNGDGTFSAPTYHGFGFSFGNLSSWELVIADFNGDGLTDYGRTGASYSHFFLSNGDGTFSAPTYHGFGFSFGSFSSWELVIADFNGDGLTDYGRTSTSYSHFFLGQSEMPVDSVKTINSALNNKTNISYNSITDSSVYTKGSSATYPEIDIQGPVYVVSKVTVEDGIGGTRDTNYTYAEAKSSIDGRGFLGFKTMSAVDSSTGINTTTTYSQTHPYIGLVERTEQRLSNNDLLGEVDTTFANKQTHIGIETDTSHPGVLFPYAATVTKKDYEISTP